MKELFRGVIPDMYKDWAELNNMPWVDLTPRDIKRIKEIIAKWVAPTAAETNQ